MKAKKQEHPQQLALVSYEHKGAEVILEQTRIEVTPLTIELSEEFSSMNRPTEKDTSVSMYFGQVTSVIQSALEKILGLFGVDSTMASGISLKQRMEDEIEQKKEEHTLAENELRILKGERKKLGDSLREQFRTWSLVRFLIAILLFGEVCINWKIFTLLTGNVWLAIFSAMVLSLALLALVMVQDKLLEISSHIGVKVVVFIAMTGMVFILLHSLADMRITFLTITNKSISDQVDPFTFIIINAVFYIAGMGLSVMYRPSVEEKKLYKKQQKSDFQIAEKQKQVQQLKHLYQEELPRKKDKELSERYSIMKLAESFAMRTEALHQEMFDLFVSTNIRQRTDGITPGVFNDRPTIKYQSNFES